MASAPRPRPRFSPMRFLVTFLVIFGLWLLLTGRMTSVTSVLETIEALVREPTVLLKANSYKSALASKDPRRIRAAFDGDIRNNPSDPETYMEIALVCASQNRYDLAREVLERSLVPCRDAPREVRAQLYTELSQVYLQLDKRKPQTLAIIAAQRAVDLAPENFQNLNMYGYLLADNGMQLDEALARTREALVILKKSPNNAETRYETGVVEDSYGWALYKLGRFTDAVSALNQAVADTTDPDVLPLLDPSQTPAIFSDLYYHLGAAYHAAGQAAAAKDALQTALRYSSANLDAKAELEALKSSASAVGRSGQPSPGGTQKARTAAPAGGAAAHGMQSVSATSASAGTAGATHDAATLPPNSGSPAAARPASVGGEGR